MISIVSKRVKGAGKGTEMNFPTINLILNELPVGLEQGLYASILFQKEKYSNKINNCFSLISIDKGKYRIETHAINQNAEIKENAEIKVNVDDRVEIIFLNKLREPKKMRDVKLMIESDIKLVSDYFTNFKTCLSCQLCYIKDYGYSNYTVEGSDIGCYANVFEESDSGDSITEYNSAGCNYMIRGDHWRLDVDGENLEPTEEWRKSMIRDVKITNLLK